MFLRNACIALVLWFCACGVVFGDDVFAGSPLSYDNLPESSINVNHMEVVYMNLNDDLIKKVDAYLPSMAPLVIKKVNTYNAEDNLAAFTLRIEKVAKQASALCVYVNDDLTARAAISIAKKYNLPIIFLVHQPSDKILNSYELAYFAGYDLKDAGRVQGEILTAYLKTHHVDFNRDGILNIIVIKGPKNAPVTKALTSGCLEVLEASGLPYKIGTQYITNSRFDGGFKSMDMAAVKFDLSNVEGIICNNDLLALGALKSIMRFCYNGYGSPVVIPLVGIGGDERVYEYINDYGSILGTVCIDTMYFVHMFTALAHELQVGNKPTSVRYSRMKGKKVFINYRKYVTQFNHYLVYPEYKDNWLTEGLKLK